MITANFSGEKVFSNSTEAFSLNEKSKFGEKLNNKIEYSLPETLYLIKEKKLNLIQNKKELSLDEAIKKFKRLDKRIETKFAVFNKLRKKGHILKTALKFGADFRVYEKGTNPGKSHSKWILFCVRENQTSTWQDFAAKNRVAHSTKKKLLIGIVDEEDDVTFYEIGWINP